VQWAIELAISHCHAQTISRHTKYSHAIAALLRKRGKAHTVSKHKNDVGLGISQRLLRRSKHRPQQHRAHEHHRAQKVMNLDKISQS
jgi:uncharacterized protein (DUF2336 family)